MLIFKRAPVLSWHVVNFLEKEFRKKDVSPFCGRRDILSALLLQHKSKVKNWQIFPLQFFVALYRMQKSTWALDIFVSQWQETCVFLTVTFRYFMTNNFLDRTLTDCKSLQIMEICFCVFSIDWLWSYGEAAFMPTLGLDLFIHLFFHLFI